MCVELRRVPLNASVRRKIVVRVQTEQSVVFDEISRSPWKMTTSHNQSNGFSSR